MSKDRPSMRGRGTEILGRGVDALFSAPEEEAGGQPTGAAPAPGASDPEAELERMLEAEARAATGGVEARPGPRPEPESPPPAPTPRPAASEPRAQPPPPAAPQPRPQPSPAVPPQVAGEGVVLSDEELLRAIDVPLGAPLSRREPQVSDEEIDVPLRADEVEPAVPPPSPVPPPRPATPSAPPVSERPESARPQPPLETARPEPAVTPAAPEVPPPRVRFAGPLTEVVVSERDLDEDSVRPQSPFIRPPEPVVEEPPRPARTPEDEARLLARLDPARLTELNRQIDQLYQDVPKNISNRPDLTNQILGMLRQARTILTENPQDFVEAEYKIHQAYALYTRVDNSSKWGDQYGWRIFWFEVVLFFIFVITFLGLLAFGNEFSKYLAGLLGIEEPGQGVFTAVGFWAVFVWGGIGGVLGAIYTLWTHVSQRQDFERQHVMWYFAQPIMGLILGGVTFLIIETGLLSLQGGESAALALREQVQLFPALLAFIAGFRPQFVFGLLIKIIKIINPSEEDLR